MGIGWLWIYTHSDNSAALASENESRAFSIYSRWRAIVRWAVDRYANLMNARQKRLSRRTMLALSDHLLQDIGMFRSGDDVCKEKHGRRKHTAADKTIAGNIENKTASKKADRYEAIANIEYFSIKQKTTRVESEPKNLCRFNYLDKCG